MESEDASLIEHMPWDVMFRILENLDAVSLVQCSLVSTRWYRMASHDQLWKRLYTRQWGTASDDAPHCDYLVTVGNHMWKSAYITRHEVVFDYEEYSHDVGVHIWDDNSDSLSFNEYEGGKKEVTRGTLNQILIHLTGGLFDSELLNTVLRMYRSFMSPQTLFQKLVERYDVPDSVCETQAAVIRLRVAVVLWSWVRCEQFDSYLERRLIPHIIKFCEGVQDTAPNNGTDVLRKIIAKLHQMDSCYIAIKKVPPPTLEPSTRLSVADLNSLEVAQQLTLIDFEIFSKLKPIEFFHQAWSVEKYNSIAPNIIQLVGRFNAVSNWVSGSVVMEQRLRDRVKVMEKFISIANECLHINNLLEVLAIMCGLNDSSVLRLSRTRQQLVPEVRKSLNDLERVTSMDRSFNSLRTLMREIEPPALPYIGVALMDVTFILEGSAHHPAGSINVAQLRMMSKCIDSVLKFQQGCYELPVVPELRRHLLHLPHFGANDLYKYSLLHEPRQR